MKNSLHMLLYAVVLGLVCATALTGVDRFTAERKKANAKAEEIRNILDVLGVSFDSRSSSKKLADLFEKNVRAEKRGELTTYTYCPPADATNVQAVAIEFGGPGLWGPIKGFLSLDADMKVIRGITFHEQEETPGLGGEIGSRWFREQFRGKSVTDATGRPGIRIRFGGAVGDNEVDAVSGATMTCEKVESMLNAAIERIAQERNARGQ